jgi:hypothetical protein
LANEFKHKDPGTVLTQAEFIASDGTGHIFDSQAQGDIVYASSTTVLSRLAKSTTSTQYLANTGTNNNPQWNEVALTTGVSGTLPVANGGTGITSLGSGVATFMGTPSSANLRSALTDETGTGGAVFATNPSLAGVTVSSTLDANGTVDADVTDFDVLSSGDIDLVSSNDAAAAVYIAQSTGTSGTVKIHADTGTSVAEGAESINILSDVGGIGIRSTANLANAINITSDGGTTGTITVFNDQGTSVTEGAASIELLSDAGGVELRSTANLANAINITSDGGTTGSITLFNDQGTTATEGAASIQLLSDVGGVGIKSGLNAAGAIRLTADAGTSETIEIHADQGSGATSINLLSDAGGITLNAGSNIAIQAGAGNDVSIGDGTTILTVDGGDDRVNIVGTEDTLLNLTDAATWTTLIGGLTDTGQAYSVINTVGSFLRLSAGSATGLIIDTTGAVSKPLQPCVLAFKNSATNNGTGNGSVMTLDYTTEVFDQNADFASNTTFTAPTTGRYLVMCQVRFAGVTAAASEIDIHWTASNRGGRFWQQVEMASDTGVYTEGVEGGSIIVDMDASDTLTTTFVVYGIGSEPVDVSGHASILDTYISIMLAA